MGFLKHTISIICLVYKLNIVASLQGCSRFYLFHEFSQTLFFVTSKGLLICLKKNHDLKNRYNVHCFHKGDSRCFIYVFQFVETVKVLLSRCSGIAFYLYHGTQCVHLISNMNPELVAKFNISTT